MPTSAYCLVSGCAEPIAYNSRCAEHALRADREAKARQPWRDYGTGWRRLRRQVQREEPNCRRCGAPGTDVDHIVPLRLGGAPRARANLQNLCRNCHASKTAAEQRGLVVPEAASPRRTGWYL